MPFASVDVTDKSIYTLVPTGWESTEDSQVKSPFFVGYLVAISFAVLMLVNFKKRKKQLRYGKICYLIIILTMVYMFNLVNKKLDLLAFDNQIDLNVTYNLGMYLLVASLPILFLANRSIKKDEDLIKSIDRLR
jgi:hypothetical protein